MDRAQATALLDLQMHWDTAYVIGYDPESGEWTAQFRGDDSQILTGLTPEHLRELVREDYRDRSPIRERTSV